MKVVPKSARITVMTRDSKYSRTVDLVNVASEASLVSVICQVFLLLGIQLLQRLPCSGLFGRLSCQANASGNDFPSKFNIDGKQFFVIRPGFADGQISDAEPVRLRALLQRRLEVDGSFSNQTDSDDLRLHESSNQSSRCFQSAVQIDGADNGFQGIHEQGLFRTAARLFFAFAKVEVLSQLKLFGILHQVCGTDQKAFELE